MTPRPVFGVGDYAGLNQSPGTGHTAPMGYLQESLTKVFPKFSQYKWVAKLVMCVEVIWLIWVNFIQPGIDAAGRYEFVRSDWPAIKSAMMVLATEVGRVAGSPAAAIGVFFFGFVFLYLDRRFGEGAAVFAPSPPKLEEEKQESSPPDESEAEDTNQTASDDDQSFPIAFELGQTGIVKVADGSLNISDTKSARADAFVASFTNEDLAPHYVSARLTYRYERRSVYGAPLRVINNPTWLDQAGNSAYFLIHQTRYLVLAAQNRAPHPQQPCSLEDHRLTSNASLGIESRILEPLTTSIKIELTVDGTRTKEFNLRVNFKTLRFFPKESAASAESGGTSRLINEKTKP